MVRFALRKAVIYASTRKTFGHTLLEHQGVAWSLANVANQLEAASLLTEKAVSTISTGNSKQAILAASHAKKFTSEMVEPALVACIQSMGAEGLREEHLLGHHMSAARIANYVDGSTEIQTERISKSLLQTYGT
jgi:alkylation response protein AidB-like acyl-CoA dehydrogenase